MPIKLGPALFFLAALLPAMTNAASTPPIYPGASIATAPSDLGEKPLPPSAKTYATADSFVKVRAWYRARLPGVPEIAQPGKEDSMDAFLVGSGPSATVVMIRSLNGKTWIAIGPPF